MGAATYLNVNRIRVRGVSVAIVFAVILSFLVVVDFIEGRSLVPALTACTCGFVAGVAGASLAWHWRSRHPVSEQTTRPKPGLRMIGSLGILAGQAIALFLLPDADMTLRLGLLWLGWALVGFIVYIVVRVPDEAWGWVGEKDASELGIENSSPPTSPAFKWLAVPGFVLIVVLLAYGFAISRL